VTTFPEKPTIFLNRELPLNGPAVMENYYQLEEAIVDLQNNGTISPDEDVITDGARFEQRAVTSGSTADGTVPLTGDDTFTLAAGVYLAQAYVNATGGATVAFTLHLDGSDTAEAWGGSAVGSITTYSPSALFRATVGQVLLLNKVQAGGGANATIVSGRLAVYKLT